MDEALKLLAQKRFGRLSTAEQRFFQAVGNRQTADYSSKEEQDNDPANAGKWEDDRVLKADRIAWLCTDVEALSLVSHHGIEVNGARIDGDLELEYAKLRFPLIFKRCALLGRANLRNSEICSLNFVGSHTRSIDCAGSEFQDAIYLCDGFRAEGTVCLDGVTMRGTLDCTGAQFINSGGLALDADGLRVTGDVLLHNGFKAEGMVSLVGAQVGGNLECNQGEFNNKGSVALNAERLNVNGDVFLCVGSWGNSSGIQAEGFKAEGEVKLIGANIGGTLECGGGQFINPGGPALRARGIMVGGRILLHHGFKAEGMVSLLGATIGGNLECNQGEFVNKGGIALDAERSNIGGDVFLCSGFWGEGKKVLAEGFKAEGETKLVRAVIAGTLDCTSGMFDNPGSWALRASGLRVKGNILLSEGFRANGEVGLLGVTVVGNLECNNGEFMNSGKVALNGERLKVGGDVFLCEGLWRKDKTVRAERFRAVGEVKLIGANIDGSVKFTGASFADEQANGAGSVNLFGATIGRELVWTQIVSAKEVTLDLRFVKVAKLSDDHTSWPRRDKLRLDGLVYGSISSEALEHTRSSLKDQGWGRFVRFMIALFERLVAPFRGDGRASGAGRGVKVRIEWLRRQGAQFHYQPYEQLVAILRRDGRDNDAKTVLIAKARDRARLTRMPVFNRFWHSFLGLMIGYGYRPWRAFRIAVFIVALGYILFGQGHKAGIITESKEMEYVSAVGRESVDIPDPQPQVTEDYPKFNSLMYSLDVFIPLVDLHQANYWLPNAKLGGRLFQSEPFSTLTSGRLLCIYMWFHILVGWILTTLLFVGLSGLVRR